MWPYGPDAVRNGGGWWEGVEVGGKYEGGLGREGVPFSFFFFFYQNLKQARETCGLRFWSSPFQSGIILENNDIWSCYVLREGMSQLHAVVVLCWGRSTAWWSGQVSEVYGNTAVVQLAKRTLSFLFWGIKMSRIKSAQFMLYPSSLLSILTVNDEHVSVPEILSTMRSVTRAAAWSTRPASLAVQLEARHSIPSWPHLKKDSVGCSKESLNRRGWGGSFLFDLGYGDLYTYIKVWDISLLQLQYGESISQYVTVLLYFLHELEYGHLFY